MEKGTVSIIMPAYNSERTIMRAITSVERQTYTNWQLIIVDDGSVDKTSTILASLTNKKIKVISNTGNKGKPYSRQRALDSAQGEFIAMVDSDDWWVPEKLDKQVEILNTNQDVDCVSGGMFIVDQDGNLVGVTAREATETKYVVNPLSLKIAHGPAVIRKSCCDKVEYDERLKYAQDIDFLRSVLINRKFTELNELLYVYSAASSVTFSKHYRTTLYNMRSFVKWFKYFPRETIFGILVSLIKLSVIFLYRAAGRHEKLLNRRWKKPSPVVHEQYTNYCASANFYNFGNKSQNENKYL